MKSMKTQKTALHSIDSALKKALVPAAAIFALGATADEVVFEGGSTVIVPEAGIVNISTTGQASQGAYTYYNPDTGRIEQTQVTKGPGQQTLLAFMLNQNYGVTFKPQGDGQVWAQLSGDASHQLITISEPVTQDSTLTIDRVVLANGRGARGGALAVSAGGNPRKLTLAGDMIFQENAATNSGGAIVTGAGTLEFTGNVIFDSNNATGGTTGSGGAIEFAGAGQNNERLIFGGTTLFLNNSAHRGGAIFAGVDATKTLEFNGVSVFQGNRAGNIANTGNNRGSEGGAIYVDGGNSRSYVKFNGSTAFMNNASSSQGGAIYITQGDVIFADDGPFQGAKSFVFSRNASTFGSTAGSGGGGAISAGTYGNSGNTSSVYFLASTSTLSMTGNMAAILYGSDTSAGSNNAGIGGAIRAMGGVYLLAGSSEFTGNQARSSGGAIEIHTGGTPAGSAYRNHGIIYNGNTETYKYKLQINGNASFKGNVARRDGGAIYGFTGNAINMYIGGNSEFIGNMAGSRGGAIFVGTAGSLLTLDAQTGNITFVDNMHQADISSQPVLADINAILNNTSGAEGYMTYAGGSPNDVWFGSTGSLELNSTAGNTIYFGGGVSSSNNAAVAVTKSGAGDVIFGAGSTSDMAATTSVTGGGFILQDGARYDSGGGTFALGAGATLGGAGSMRATTTAGAGFTIIVGDLNDTVARSLSFTNNLSVASGTIKLDLFDTSGAYDAISIDTSRTFTATGITTIDTTALGSDTYSIITAGAVAASANNFVLRAYGSALTQRNLGSTVSIAGNSVVINGVMNNLATTWNSTSGVWRDGIDTAWVAAVDASEKFFRNGDKVTFTDTGAGTVAIDSAGVKVADMLVDSAADYTFTGSGGIATVAAVSGTYITAGRKLIQKGTGVLIFENAANTFGEGIDIEAGTLAFNKTSQVEVGAGKAISFTGDATLKLNASAMTLAGNIAIDAGKTGTLDMGANILAFDGALSGVATSNLVKTGGGAITLTADSSAYDGAMRIQGGSLILANAGARLGGAITLESGATLAGVGESTGSLTASAGSLVQVGIDSVTTAQNLTLNNLTMNGATLSMELYDHAATQTANTSDTITLTGGYIAGAGTNILNIQTLKVGEYNLGNLGAFADQSWTILLAGQSQVGARQSGSIANVGGDLILKTTSDISRDSTWTGNSGSTWNISQTDWDVSGTTAYTFAGGDSVKFDGAASIRDITIEGNANVSGMDVSGDADHSFSGGGIRADVAFIIPDSSLTTADGKLAKSGNGTLTFNNTANSFKGGIEIGGGVIAFNNGGQINTLGAGISFIGNGTLKANAGGMTVAEAITIADTLTATIDTNGNNLVYTGTLTAPGTDANFEKTGLGVIYIEADNSVYNGKTSVTGGAMLLVSDTAALGGSVTVGAGAIFGGIGSAGGAVQAQANATIQVAAADATGTLSFGSLALANNSVITGNGELAAGGLAIGGAAGDKVYARIASDDTLTLNAATENAGTLVKQDAGTLNFSGTSALGHAATQLQGGLVTVQDITLAQSHQLAHTFVMDGGWLDLSIPDTANGRMWDLLTFESGENAEFGGVYGNESIIFLGSGTIAFTIGKPGDADKSTVFVNVYAGDGQATVLTGTNYFTDGISVHTGTLVIGSEYNIGGQAGGGSVLLTGGELRVTGSSGSVMASPGPLVLYEPAGVVTVDAGVEASFGTLGVAGSGSNGIFTKKGDGALIFTGNSSDGAQLDDIDLEAGTIGAMGVSSLGAVTLDESQSYIAHGATINVLGANATVRVGNDARLGNFINLNNNTLALEVPADDATATYYGSIGGSGGINKTGAGTLVLISEYNTDNTYSGETRVSQGMLVFANARAFSPNSTVYRTESQGALGFDGFAVTLPKLYNNGAVYAATSGTWLSGALVSDVNTIKVGEYHGGEGSVLYLRWGTTSDTDYRLKFDRITFENGATVTGTTQIVFVYPTDDDKVVYNSLSKRGASDYVSELDHTVIDDNVGAGLVFTGTFNVSGRKYVFKADEYGDLVVEKIGLVPEWQALLAIDSQAIFAGRAALDALSRRFTTLRVETGMPKRGYDMWLGGMHREDRVSDTVYDGTKIITDGVQAGVDYVDRSISTAFFFGATFDYMSTSAKLDADFGYLNMEHALNKIHGDSTSYGVGLYGGMRDGPWYVEASARASKDEYKGSNAIYSNYKIEGAGFGGSIETGYSFTGAESGWVFEPQAQMLMQRSTVDPASIESEYYPDGTYVNIDTVQSMLGRVGLKIYRGVEYKPGCKITPYVRGSIMHEFAGKNKTTINETTIDNDLGGSAGMIEFGINARLTQRFDVALEGSYYYGNKNEGYSINGGIRFNW
jgi:autotransporter-associated beta strand protein